MKFTPPKNTRLKWKLFCASSLDAFYKASFKVSQDLSFDVVCDFDENNHRTRIDYAVFVKGSESLIKGKLTWCKSLQESILDLRKAEWIILTELGRVLEQSSRKVHDLIAKPI